jgi:hypothetical protein
VRQDESLRQEIHDALDWYIRPAPGLAAKAIERVRADGYRMRPGSRLRGPARAAVVLATGAGIALIVIAIHEATHRGQQPQLGSNHPTSFVCANVPDLLVQPLPEGAQPLHTAADALSVSASVGPREHRHAYVAWVTYPIGLSSKFSWGSPGAPRIMWVVDGTETIQAPSSNPSGPPIIGPAPVYSPGTVLRIVTLVDDATLELGGNFACGVVAPGH